MNQKEKINRYEKKAWAEPREEKIQETIRKSKHAFFMAEQNKVLTYHEFLWTQFCVIQKRWWLLQLLILAALWLALSAVQEEFYVKRSMGVAAALFVIFIIPELWKNRTRGCMEIEGAAYYSLKQIYAARMLLFGIADLFLVTLFLGTASAGLHLELLELTIQFLFPLCVTACICFGILCSKYPFSEPAAMLLCLIWSGVWLFIVLNEAIYQRITVPIWLMLLGAAVVFLIFTVKRSLKNCNQYLEVSFDETGA